MTKNYINWPEIYNQSALFHIYLTERGRGKSDTKGWQFLEIITTNRETNLAWIRRRWHDSLLATKPFFQSLIYSFCEEKKLNLNQFEVKEQGVFYQGLLRIHFYDLFSYQRVRGAIARTSFAEIVFEEAIPIDQEFLPREQHDFRDLVKSLKGRKGKDGERIPTKITFLANAYSWSAWLLDVFTNLFKLKKEAEIKKEKNDNDGVLEIVKDKKGVEWLLYINLIEGEDDPHYSALEEKINPSQRNWDDFMIDEPNKYKILHALQDFYFCEIGVRKVNKKYCLMHFTKNKKETDKELVNFCFNLEEKAKSKLKNCVLRKKPDLISKWVNMLKEGMLNFSRFSKSRLIYWDVEIMNNIIAADPGGKTGIYFTDGKIEEFFEVNKPWPENYQEIKELIQQKQANLVLFEDTNYIHKRTRDGLNLFRLLGAIECLEVQQIRSVNVLKVKEMTKKLLNGFTKIENLEYLRGRGKGWMYKNKRISIHQLEAYLVFYLFFQSQS